MTNEQTSKRVGKLAAMLLALDDYYLDVWINDDPQRARKALRTLAASALTQAADKPLRVDRQPAPKRRPYDDRGFDPRDGGKIGREHVPKRNPRACKDSSVLAFGLAKMKERKGKRAKR